MKGLPPIMFLSGHSMLPPTAMSTPRHSPGTLISYRLSDDNYQFSKNDTYIEGEAAVFPILQTGSILLKDGRFFLQEYEH